MAKNPKNHGKPITKDAVKQVKDLAKQNIPARVVGIKTGRTENSVLDIAIGNDISLKATNQSPYIYRMR